MPRKKLAVVPASRAPSQEKTVIDVRPIRRMSVVATKSPKPFERSKRYRDLVELAENMHQMAAVSGRYVRSSAVQMFAHHLLLIAHRQYRKTTKGGR